MSNDSFSNDLGESMMEGYQRCANFLGLDKKPQVGFTVVVSEKWVFVAICTSPYAHAPNGNPTYLDGFDFTGLITL